MKKTLLNIYKPLIISIMTIFWIAIYAYIIVVFVAGLNSLMPASLVAIQIVILLFVIATTIIIPVFVSWSIFKQIDSIAKKFLNDEIIFTRREVVDENSSRD